jgi:hypothetical protein
MHIYPVSNEDHTKRTVACSKDLEYNFNERLCKQTYLRIVNVNTLASTVEITSNNYWFGTFQFLQTKRHTSVACCKVIFRQTYCEV